MTCLLPFTLCAFRAWCRLREWNDIVRPALPLIDLRLYEVEEHISHSLCLSKGRLLPGTKAALIDRALKLSGSSKSIPRVTINFQGAGAEGTVESTFEQLFESLYSKHPLTNTNTEEGEGQLWEVRMTGDGATAFTDTTDIGGHFRTSLRKMCADLQSPPGPLPNGKTSVPLFVLTPNFVRGVGDGNDAAENFLPNPECTAQPDLERYRFVGTLCGAAARFTAFMELDLPSLCWKSILGQAADTHELRTVDTKTAAHLESVRAVEDEATWQLRQESEPVRWCVRLVSNKGQALRGDGTALVAFSEKEEYAALAEKKWLAQFEPQLKAMQAGFYAVFPELGARLLTWRELERRKAHSFDVDIPAHLLADCVVWSGVCGLPDVDVSQLQRIAKYEGSYTKDDAYIKQFWKVLRELTGQERKQLLGFVRILSTQSR